MGESETLLHDRYSIVHIQRTSSFSKVFFALDTYQNPPRSCVIKVFEPIIQKPQIAKWIHEEFQKEVKQLKQLSLSNQHLPQIYSYSSEFQVYYLVRELIEGETLKEKVKIRGILSVKEVRELLTKLLPLLSDIHQDGVIHQNIKPKNIILRDEDRMPMLINFGSIKQIVATYDFYGDKQIFSASNVYGYAPPEQALGKSVRATDLYSLGLTAVYLLTGKDPTDLAMDSSSGSFRLPEQIAHADPNLARIIARTIALNSGDRYSSAQEMLDDLLVEQDLWEKSEPAAKQPTSDYQWQPISTPIDSTQSDRRHQQKQRKKWFWVRAIACAFGGLYLICTGIIAYYDWYSARNTTATQLPEPLVLLPSSPAEPSPTKTAPPLTLNRPSDEVIEIPIFPTGTSEQDLRQELGEPNAIQKGYWANSSAWIYKGQANGAIDLGYLFDLDTGKLQQTEVAIAQAVGLGTTQDILDSLLQGKTTPSISQALQDIYNHQATEYSFELKGLEGSIQREKDGHVYLGVWQAGFH